jgi:TatD DNase family protein
MARSSPIEIPDLGAPVSDSHAHLSMLEDPVGALERAALAGVEHVVTIVYPLDAEERASLELLPGWLEEAGARVRAQGGAGAPDVVVAAGVHPHEAKDYDDAAEGVLRGLVTDGALVAIGETGLDFHYDHSPRDDQRRAFRAQLALAHEAGLPVIVHLREAHEEGRDILADAGVPEAGCVIHCYGEGPELAESFLAMGCMVSFAGTVTFKKADTIRESARVVPLERLLVETDCPFLAPEPVRGRKNEPAFTVFTAAKVAEARGEDPALVARAAYDNARRLFGASAGAREAS